MDKSKTNSNFARLWVIYLLYPMGSFLFALKNFNVKKYRIFLLLFGLFYALSYIPTENSDATTYIEQIAELNDYPFSKYWYDITHMYSATAKFSDAYIYTVFFIVSKFSNDPLIYRLIFALVYFYTLLKLVSSIYDYVKENKTTNFVIWFLLGVLFLMNLSSGINGVRFPLALQLFLLGLFKYIVHHKPKYLLISFAAFFVHFAIGYLLAFVLLFLLTKKFYNSFYAIFFALLFFVLSLTMGNVVSSYSSLLGKGIEQRATAYTTNVDYKEQRNEHLESLNWYIKFNRYSTYYYGLLALGILVLYQKKLYKDKVSLNLEYFAILMYIASFISAQLVDEISNRYFLFANGAFLIYMFYLTSINNNRFLKLLTYAYIPICILHILIMLRGDQETISYNLIIGNVFTELFKGF